MWIASLGKSDARVPPGHQPQVAVRLVTKDDKAGNGEGRGRNCHLAASMQIQKCRSATMLRGW